MARGESAREGEAPARLRPNPDLFGLAKRLFGSGVGGSLTLSARVADDALFQALHGGLQECLGDSVALAIGVAAQAVEIPFDAQASRGAEVVGQAQDLVPLVGGARLHQM